LQTAIASAAPWKPAIGAWMRGSSLPRKLIGAV
jgi:hypothetical protein